MRTTLSRRSDDQAATGAERSIGEAGPAGGPQEIERLKKEVESLRRGLVTRELIGQATGLLAAWLRISTGEAWEVMRALSNHTNLRAREVARLLVASADGPVTEPEDRAALDQLAGAIDTERTRRTLASARDRAAGSPAEPDQ